MTTEAHPSPAFTGDLTKILKVGDLLLADGWDIPCRVICIDAPGNRPLIFLQAKSDSYSNYSLHTYPASGFPLTFRRYSPYADFKLDDPVMCRNSPSDTWARRHFAGIDPATGLPRAYRDGVTSFSTWNINDSNSWTFMRPPTEEELAAGPCALKAAK